MTGISVIILYLNILQLVCLLAQLEGYCIPDEDDIGYVGHWGGTKPVHYSINMTVIDEINYKICLEIELEAVENTYVIYLNAGNRTKFMKDMGNPRLHDSKSNISIVKVDQNGEVLIIVVDGILKEYEKYFLDFGCFSGMSNHSTKVESSESNGLALSNPINSNYWIWTTLFQMRMARRVFPCYDHPALKATYNFCVKHEEDVKVFSNMDVLTLNVTKLEYQPEKMRIETCFQKTPVISSYLFSFAIGKGINLEKRLLEKTKVHFELICVPSIECTDALNKIAPGVDSYIESMQEYTGLLYPLTKLSYIFTDNYYYGAMENFGLITSHVEMLDNYNMIAHEIIHQWIGNVVTGKDWKDLCLQEGLTTYLADVFTDTNFVSFRLPLWNDRPLISSVQDINQFYICYHKAPYIFYLLEDYYGMIDDPFIPKFVRQLVVQCKWSNCNLDDWKDAMTTAYAGDKDPTRIFASFYETPGFTVLVAKIRQNNLVITVADTEEKNGLILPITYFDSQNNSVKFILEGYKPAIISYKIHFGTPGSWFRVVPAEFWGVVIYPVENYISLFNCYNAGYKNDCGLSTTQIKNFIKVLEKEFCDFVNVKHFLEQEDNEKWRHLLNLTQNNGFGLRYYNDCIKKIIK